MDLQSKGGKPVTSGNLCPPDNFRAHSPQIPDDNRPQPDTSAIELIIHYHRGGRHGRRSGLNNDARHLRQMSAFGGAASSRIPAP